MSKRIFMVFGFIFFLNSLFAQIEVPVTYQFTPEAPVLDGVLSGGSIFDADGLIIRQENATFSETIEFADLDRIEELKIENDKSLSMQVTLLDGYKFKGFCDFAGGVPILVLRDETVVGNARHLSNPRMFTPDNFKGIASIEFQVGVEIDFEALQPLAEQFLASIKRKDPERTLEIYIAIKSQLGEEIEDDDGEDESEDDDGEEDENYPEHSAEDAVMPE